MKLNLNVISDQHDAVLFCKAPILAFGVAVGLVYCCEASADLKMTKGRM